MSYIDIQAKKIGYYSYDHYINSEKWKLFAKAQKLIFKKCLCCENSSDLTVHHISYKNLGQEEPTDTIVICAACHKLIHDMIKLGQASIKNAHIKLMYCYKKTKKKYKKPYTVNKRKNKSYKSQIIPLGNRKYCFNHTKDLRLKLAARNEIDQTNEEDSVI